MAVNKIRYGALIVLLGTTLVAHATGAGFYLGADAGKSNTHNQPMTVNTGGTPATVYVNPSNTGFGARIYLGYSVNQYVGFEGGYTYYAPSTYKTNVAPICNDASIREYSYDLSGKGTFPVAKTGVGIFAKAGVALINQAVSGCLVTVTNGTCGTSGGQTTLRPMAALGASYDITQSWVTDVTFSRVFSGSGIQNADLVAIGLSYHFVNEQCGQFLC